MKLNIWNKFVGFLKHRPKVTSRDFKTKTGRKKIWRLVFVWFVYLVLASIIFVGLAFVWFAKDLPTPSKIANRKLSVSTKVYDRTGQYLLYETGDQKRTLVKSEDIPQSLKDATIAVEDARFYQHHGFDTKAIFTAIYEKITGKTRTTRGGSTITQQYVKNSFLTSDRSLVRKFKELILSIELEMMYNKDEILTMYLNEIPYGNGTAGVESASIMYYGKSAKDLSLAQSATLASIPQAPTKYSPYGTHVDLLVNRRDYVLNQMVRIGKITQEEADAAKKEDTTTLNVAVQPRRNTMNAPHFAMFVLDKIADKYGEDTIQKDGLRVITTLDMDKQKKAEEAIAAYESKLDRYGANNAALVAVDPKTGQILSMVGSRNYFNRDIDGQVNVTDSRRQPGSSWKPIVYSALFKDKFSPSSTIFDVETDFGNYTPQNATDKNYGPLTVRQSLANSLNIPAIKATMMIGIDNVIKNAVSLGITGIDSPEQRKLYGASFGIGVAEVKPVDMASAFGAFANGGYKNDTVSVLEIYDQSNKKIYDFEKERKEAKKVLEPEIAYQIASMMSDNEARQMIFGLRSPLYFPERPVAVKTGTTSDNKDAWTVGYTPSLSTAVWIGNTRGEKMKRGAFGSDLAAPIFHKFIVDALAGTPREEFTRPSTISELTVARYSNKLPSETTTETVTDIFAPWQIPSEKDDSFVKVRVCKSDGKLAPEGATSDLIEEKVFANIHSEKPNNPNWENPVRAWLSNAGYLLSLPTETCDLSSVNPDITITSPAAGSNVVGQSDINIQVNTAVSVNKVEIIIDGSTIATLTSAPYSVSYNFSSLSGGAHIITAILTDNNGKVGTNSITISTPKNEEEIVLSGILANLITSTEATINWSTNTESTSSVSYWPASNPSAKQTVNNANKTIEHTIILSGLTPSTNYKYTVSSANSLGTKSSNEAAFTTLASFQSQQQSSSSSRSSSPD